MSNKAEATSTNANHTTSVYEALLPKLTAVLELTQNMEGPMTPQAKQALLFATNDFKNCLGHAKELAQSLPGGELMLKEQDDVIEMLEQLRDRKRQKLANFSKSVVPISAVTLADDVKMELDSMASTPSQG